MDTLIAFIEQFGIFSYLVSILINIGLNILAVVPTAIMTTINITLFDLKVGIIITFIGEIAGTIISFYLYRLGIRKINYITSNIKWLEKIKLAEGTKAFYYVLLGRLAPVIPSSIVTIAAAFSKINIFYFSLATIIGKIPALAMEVLLILGFLQLDTSYKILFLILIVVLFVWKSRKNK